MTTSMVKNKTIFRMERVVSIHEQSVRNLSIGDVSVWAGFDFPLNILRFHIVSVAPDASTR